MPNLTYRSINLPNLTYKITNLLSIPQRLHDIRVEATNQAEGAPPCQATLTDGSGTAHAVTLSVQQDPNGRFYLATLPPDTPAPYPTLLTIGAGETVTLSIANFNLSLLIDSSPSGSFGLRNVSTFSAQTAFFSPATNLTPLSVDLATAPWSVQVTTPSGGPFNTEAVSLLSSGSSSASRRELLPALLSGFFDAPEGTALVKRGGDASWEAPHVSAPRTTSGATANVAQGGVVNLDLPNGQYPASVRKVTTSHPCRVVLYASPAERQADSNRFLTTPDSTPPAAIIAQYRTVPNFLAVAGEFKGLNTDTAYLAIRNESGADAAITVSLSLEDLA